MALFVPEVFSKVLRDLLHILQKIKTSWVLLGVFGGVILDTVVNELKSFLRARWACHNRSNKFTGLISTIAK